MATQEVLRPKGRSDRFAGLGRLPLSAAAFAATGAATLAAYAALWLEPLWLGRFNPFTGEALALGPILGLDVRGAGRYAVAAAAPMALYVAALLLLPRVPARTAWRVAIGVAVLAPVTLVYTYPALAADVFDYLMNGRVVSEYGMNPYTHPPLEFAADPYYPPVGWKGLPAVYGPVWIAVMAALTEVCGSNTLAALLATKALSVGAHWAAAGTVYLLARRLTPGKELFAFVAHAWNPLAVIHFAVDGHNDSLLLLFLLAAVWLALDRRWEVAFPVLTLSVLVKFVPAVLFPLLLWQARREPRAALTGLAASVLLAGMFFAPLWAGAATFDGVRDQASRSTSSLAAVADFYLPYAWLRPAAIAIFSLGFLAVLRRRLDVVRGSYWILLLYLLVLSFWTKAWYFTWVVGLGAAIGGGAFWVTVPGAIGLLAANVVGGWAWPLNWFDWYGRGGLVTIEAALTASTLGGWIVGLLAWAAGGRRRGRAAPSGAGALPRPGGLRARRRRPRSI
ncbi:MAG TPA: polyprenol phosphomannose-dependent alpha 1,6 mannosyltransferase MptB [Dehalococcoidia bacterium]|nr:polyprenol phosphomannose-dependent alpha 1,6 mannosyltransferase MptB [Dehalococcoidia bacterium]